MIQACNPPDIFWPIALAFRAVEGTKFVFDHHDLCPELYESRFPGGPSCRTGGCAPSSGGPTGRPISDLHQRLLPRDRHQAQRQGRQRRHGRPDRPDPDRLRRGEEDPAQRRGRKYLAAYIGVMGPQDGVDIVVRAADVIVHELGRDDIAFTLIGSGDCFDELVALRDELGLAGHVEFTGRAPDELVGRILSTADGGSRPIPRTRSTTSRR